MRYAHIRAQLCPVPWFPFCIARYKKTTTTTTTKHAVSFDLLYSKI